MFLVAIKKAEKDGFALSVETDVTVILFPPPLKATKALRLLESAFVGSLLTVSRGIC